MSWGLLCIPGTEHLLGVWTLAKRREHRLRVSQGAGLGWSVVGWEPPSRLSSCSAPVPHLSPSKEMGFRCRWLLGRRAQDGRGVWCVDIVEHRRMLADSS